MSRSWIITRFLNGNSWKEYMENLFKDISPDYLCGQLEQCPTSGRLHVQGFIYVAKRISLKQLREKDKEAHFEKVTVEREDVISYCGKEDTKIEGPIEFGRKPKFGQRAKSLSAIERRKEVNEQILKQGPIWAVENGYLQLIEMDRGIRNYNMYNLLKKTAYEHTGIRGIWIYGKPGVGKTHYARTNYPGAYIKAQNKWWDGYQGEKNVILDDFDCKELYHYLKIWLDKWACYGETKGGTLPLLYENFVITSNYLPVDLFSDPMVILAIERRIIIKNI